LGFGVLMGLLFAGQTLISYAVQPLPGKLAAAWFINGFVEFAIAGMLLGAIYRPPTAAGQAGG